MIFWWCHVSLIFDVPVSLALLSLYLKWKPPTPFFSDCALQCVLNHHLLSQKNAGISVNLDFHKGSLLCRWLSMSVFSRGPRPWLTRTEAGSHITSGSTARNAWVGKTLSKSLGVWWWIPQALVCGWMLNICCWRGRRQRQ